ncbi:hypothetical protein [Methylocucumis oryzae]|uniref:Uncharacterized protein n=1 Tax=Methylocucumis oryzae TaxID=1632867 RepID=A0A0F3IMI2_9GAMM|nr:hypothetical protein [Methylocucumis oryzae]KJV07950.1 hypothetical protein VZ94_01260 [Methylocucumis oryzae]
MLIEQKQKRKDKTESPQFPAAQYFQIHFSHLQTQLENTSRSLAELQGQVTELNNRLANILDVQQSDSHK